ncbi:MAG: polyprenyl synthetase family protein [Acidimicrobiales bacterium]
MSPHGALPPEIRVVADAVEDRLRQVLDDEIERWAAVDADLSAPLEALGRLVLGGGKRLRPAFCHWAYVGAGGDPAGGATIDAGAAFELLHAFALMHDDVMDGSATRRGTPTIHIEFSGEHERGRWRGEGRRFGEGVAILVGDLAGVYADRMLDGTPPDARRVWDELKIELNIGQYLDVLGTARGGTDLATARRIARYKSGKYTIERPLHLGAALAGRLDELRAPLSAYGDPLGEAFQLRDDVLGSFGDSAVTGKPVGDDLREGKPTPMLAIAVAEVASDPAATALLDRVGAPDLTAGEVESLQALLESSGARRSIETTIQALTDRAVEAIDEAPIGDEARTALVALARYVAARER